MITDEQIKRLALVIVVIGIGGMLIISQFAGPEKIAVKDITEDKIGRVVEVTGTISSFFSKDGNVFLDLQDEMGKIPVVMFERDARSQKSVYDMKKGINITVRGKILLYKAELEIQAGLIKSI